MDIASMETRLLGGTGLQVSRIGLGMAALGRPGYINLGHAGDLGYEYDVAAMQRHAHEVLDVAWDGGVRYVDVARSYGRAEEFLATWLGARGHTPVIGSKWGYTYTADWQVEARHHEVKDHTLGTLERQQAESRGLLGGALRLYQIHSATESSGVLDRPEVLDRLAALKVEAGLAIGLTLSGPDSMRVLDQAMSVERDGVALFQTVQATWNLLERSLTGALAIAHREGMGVIIKEALANGRLTTRNTTPSFEAQRAILDQQAERLGSTVEQVALAAVLDQPFADCVLSGAATVEQLRSNLGASAVPIDQPARDALAELAEPIKDYWEERARLAWN